MTYLDFIFLAIIIISALVAFKRGLIKTLFGFFSTIIGIALAYIIYPTVSAILIKHTGLYKTIQEKVMVNLKLESLAKNVVTPQDQINLINQLNVPKFMKKILISNNNTEVYDLLDATGIKEYVGGTIATIAINALAFILVLVIVGILLKVIASVLDLIAKLPVIHQLNNMGGLVVGSVWGLLLVWVICVVLSFVSSVQKGGKLLVLIDQSPVVKFFYENNLLMNFVSDLSKALIK